MLSCRACSEIVWQLPQELDVGIARFEQWYDTWRYQEAISNVIPDNTYYGLSEGNLTRETNFRCRTVLESKKYNSIMRIGVEIVF